MHPTTLPGYAPDNFNIFHTNINGLESKLDNLNEFLSGSSYKMDVKEDTGFLSNVEMDEYHTAF